MEEEQISQQPQVRQTIFREDVALLITLFYVVASVILLFEIGPWMMVRYALINGAIVAAWLSSAHVIFNGKPRPPAVPIRYPRLELLWLLLTLLAVTAIVVIQYAGGGPLPRYLLPIVIYLAVGGLFLLVRASRDAWGLRWPSRHGWLVLLAATLINLAATPLFLLLPQGEASGSVVGVDMMEQLSSPLAAVATIALFIIATAIPEELLLRVGLQPRLRAFMPTGWAIFLQALFFSLLHLPQLMLGNGWPLLPALAFTLLLDNGLLAGYVWYRERSLPLLVLLHLFTFVRFGI